MRVKPTDRPAPFFQMSEGLHIIAWRKERARQQARRWFLASFLVTLVVAVFLPLAFSLKA